MTLTHGRTDGRTQSFVVMDFYLHKTFCTQIKFVQKWSIYRIQKIYIDYINFISGNCYDARQYDDYSLYCPYAYRLPNGTILAKDLAAEYNYLGNSSIWFYNARRKAQEIIDKNSPIYRGTNVVTFTLLKTFNNSTITFIHSLLILNSKIRFSPKNHQWDVSQSGWGGNSRCGLRGWRVAQALLRLRRRQHLDDDVHRPFLWIRHKPEAVFLQVSVCWKFSSFDLAITLLLTGQ